MMLSIGKTSGRTEREDWKKEKENDDDDNDNDNNNHNHNNNNNNDNDNDNDNNNNNNNTNNSSNSNSNSNNNNNNSNSNSNSNNNNSSNSNSNSNSNNNNNNKDLGQEASNRWSSLDNLPVSAHIPKKFSRKQKTVLLGKSMLSNFKSRTKYKKNEGLYRLQKKTNDIPLTLLWTFHK